jgi:hypothetical protein
MYASFDLSSPIRRAEFAVGQGKERRLYGTRRMNAYIEKGALLLAILRVRSRGVFLVRATRESTAIFRFADAGSSRELQRAQPLQSSATGPGSVPSRENAPSARDRETAQITIMHLGSGLQMKAPIEIRVSAEAITEIYGAWHPAVPIRDESVTREAVCGGGRHKNYAGSDAVMCVSVRRRRGRGRVGTFIAGYICFVALAAIVIWCTVK